MVGSRPILVVSSDSATKKAFVETLEAGELSVVARASWSDDLATSGVGLVFLDLALKDADAVAILRTLIHQTPSVPVVAVGSRTDPVRIIAAISSGAHGCIYGDDPKERILAAVKEVSEGGRPISRGMAPLLLEHIRRTARPLSGEQRAVKPLTVRERDMLGQLARGYRYEDIASALGVSVNTVRTYVRSIYEKLDVNSRTEAVLLGMKLGIVTGTPYPQSKQRR